MTNTAKIPHRFSQASFLRYAHIIAAAVQAYPNPIIVDPTPMKSDSFKQPLRDAFTAKNRFGWPLKGVDDSRYHAVAPQIMVADSNNGMIYVGSHDYIRQTQAAGIVRFATEAANEFMVSKLYLPPLLAILSDDGIKPIPNFVVAIDVISVANLSKLYPNIALVPIDNRPGFYQII